MNNLKYEYDNKLIENSQLIYNIPSDILTLKNEDFDYLEEISISPPLSDTSIIVKKDVGCYGRHIIIGNIKFSIPFFSVLMIIFCITVFSSMFAYQINDCTTLYFNNLITYMYWLHIHFWTNIGTLSILILLALFTKITKIELNVLKIITFKLGLIFHFGWYVFGGVLYFIEIKCVNSIVSIIGISLFVLQTIFWVLIIFHILKNKLKV